MADTFIKIEAACKKKSGRRFVMNVLIALVLIGLAYVAYRWLG